MAEKPSKNPDKKADENLHAGHRKRVREEFLSRGFDESTPPHKMLELLLFYCIPRVDTNPIAHEMINKYGSLAGVLDAPVDELKEFRGMTENAAVLLKLIMPIARRYLKDKSKEKATFTNLDSIGNYLLKYYAGLEKEKVGVMCMDAKAKFISFDFISEGDIGSVGLSLRDLVKVILDRGASCVVLAHNHPSGMLLPSASDTALTEMAADALSRVGVRLIDHMIMGPNDFVSMAQSAEYSRIFKG